MISGTELQERIIKALDEKFPGKKCSFCGHDDWGVQPGLVLLPIQEQTGRNFAMPGNSLPCAAVVCKTCGHTELLNLTILLPEVLSELR